jgi:hypothetical protein
VAVPSACTSQVGPRCGLLQELEHAPGGPRVRTWLVGLLTDTKGLISHHKLYPEGERVAFQLRLQGLAHRQVSLVWTLQSAAAQAPLDAEWYRSVIAERFRPAAGDETFVEQFWVPQPRASGSYLVQLAVFDQNGRELTYKDTSAF